MQGSMATGRHTACASEHPRCKCPLTRDLIKRFSLIFPRRILPAQIWRSRDRMHLFDVRFAQRILIRSAAFASSSCEHISIRFSRILPTLIPPKIAPALRDRHRHRIGEHFATSYVLACLRFQSDSYRGVESSLV